MGDVTVPGCSNVGEDTLDMDGIMQYFQENNPTLNMDNLGLEELLNTTLEHDGNQLDWGDTENAVMNDDNDYPNVDCTNGVVEGGNPEYVGDMGNEVETNMVVPFSVWPPVPTEFDCSYCNVLREFIHENGANTMKLEIHGRIGVICHAIHETRTMVIDGPPILNHEMVDFTMQSIEGVKQFIVQYCQNRTREGYVLLQDPLSVYYDALCFGFSWFNNVEINPPPDNTEAYYTRAEEENRTLANTNDARTPRPDLSSQRQRTKRLTLNDVARWFHLPINKAAEELQICTTVLKKTCRKYGVQRWPYRTVASINKKITKLEKSLTEGTGDGTVSSQIETLRKQLAEVYAGRQVNKRMTTMT
ncbi:hypothetical protein MKX01_001562 [Papaver californicum]|nr:hypothetical protein MKX01_001562 [Papaver californicum]